MFNIESLGFFQYVLDSFTWFQLQNKMKIRALLLFAIVHFIWIDGSAGLPAQNGK